MTEAQRTRAFQYLESIRESKTSIGCGGMAGRLGVSRTTFSNYKRFVTVPSEDVILKYCQVLKVNPEDTVREQAS